MFRSKTPRGATLARTQTPGFPRRHLAIGGAVACALGLLLLLPGEQKTTPEPSEDSTQVAPAPQDAPLAAADRSAAAPQPSSLPPAPPPEPVIVEPPWEELTVKRGDTLSAIFKRAGYSDRELHALMTEAEDGKDLGRIYPGQTVAFQADEQHQLLAVRHVKSPLETREYRRGDEGFSSELLQRQPEVKETWATGEIESSLFLAGQKAGMSQPLIMEMANIFGGVIDFVLDPRRGDSMRVIYNEHYLDGEKFDDGEILAASFTNRGETFNAYRYEDNEGEVGYYNEDGVSMRKAFLMAPVDFTRISSNFNLRRKHPIYKTTRPHRGTDYAAPTGTPVFAAGDGKVIRAGYSRANGNYVFIQHGQAYVTKYLHLHKRRVKTGQRVSQSQVIGTVGATGAATGPHLHYEFLVNGVHRNPRTIHKSLPKAKSLAKAEMPRFREAISRVSTQLASLEQDSRVAMSGTADEPVASP